MSEDRYAASEATLAAADQQPVNTKPGAILITIAILFVIINPLLALPLAIAQSAGINDAYGQGHFIGYVVSAAFVVQGIVIALFQIGQRFRNPRSIVKIYCWSSLFVLLGTLGNLGRLAQVAQ